MQINLQSVTVSQSKSLKKKVLKEIFFFSEFLRIKCTFQNDLFSGLSL